MQSSSACSFQRTHHIVWPGHRILRLPSGEFRQKSLSAEQFQWTGIQWSAFDCQLTVCRCLSLKGKICSVCIRYFCFVSFLTPSISALSEFSLLFTYVVELSHRGWNPTSSILRLFETVADFLPICPCSTVRLQNLGSHSSAISTPSSIISPRYLVTRYGSAEIRRPCFNSPSYIRCRSSHYNPTVTTTIFLNCRRSPTMRQIRNGGLVQRDYNQISLVRAALRSDIRLVYFPYCFSPLVE